MAKIKRRNKVRPWTPATEDRLKRLAKKHIDIKRLENEGKFYTPNKNRVLGHLNRFGRFLSIGGEKVAATHLAWLIHHDELPQNSIAFINIDEDYTKDNMVQTERKLSRRIKKSGWNTISSKMKPHKPKQKKNVTPVKPQKCPGLVISFSEIDGFGTCIYAVNKKGIEMNVDNIKKEDLLGKIEFLLSAIV